ncbi:Nn.00g072200.m01.CDS01 [Neocucurbitaria sp. VM-36]
MTTDELAPPRKSVELEDPGARELVDAVESSDEHFSDASEGRPGRSDATSPIPITRVERVDDEPAHGEVPGTDAYKMRTQDAVPDEVEIVPEGSRSRSASRVSANDRPLTPGGTPIPRTIVEKIDPDQPSYGDVPGTHAHQLRMADAEPDVVVKAPEPPQRKGSPTASLDRSPLSSDDGAAESSSIVHVPDQLDDADNDDDVDDDGFGDFDEFEEGAEGDDFGDFDDGFQQGEQEAETSFDKPPDQPPIPAPSIGPPVLDFEHLKSLEDIVKATQPYIDEIYPSPHDIPSISTNPEETRSIFLSERSHSLWTQLVAPPPLQPPDWVRSRIRRLFLVSLGVPVDLDEILPASKQKKLILPSIHIPGSETPRPSADGRNGALGRVKRENASSTSVDSSSSRPDRKRKGPPPPPELDISSTTMLCATTEAALSNFTEEELKEHVERLKGLQERAKEVFEYWQKRMESALGDKDAFEQVIESLVAHAKKLR